ncbi:hypothetical protein BGX33_009551, partial [Mortierella sp. NVP41]
MNHVMSILRTPPSAGSKRSAASIQISPSSLMPTTPSRHTSKVPPPGLLTAQDLGHFGWPTSTAASDCGLGQGRDQLGGEFIGLEGLDHELEEIVA